MTPRLAHREEFEAVYAPPWPGAAHRTLRFTRRQA